MSKEDLTPKLDSRIEEHAANMFGSLGFNAEKLPDSLVTVYTRFKKYHDIIQPSRLTVDGYAAVAVLSDIIEGKTDTAKSKAKNKE